MIPFPLNANEILTLPELAGLDARTTLIRIPPELDVPLTDRVRKIIDTAAFRRLTQISQLGLVSLVYPGARHSRFEHSLGVYRLSLLVLKRMAHDKRFVSTVTRREAELLIVSTLLHDIGHYPYCHLIEDLKFPNIPPHEQAAADFLLHGELHDIIVTDWGLDPADILTLLNHRPVEPKPGEPDNEFQRRKKVYPLLMSILSGPVDIDKMDYLSRDSLAAGVPYGRHFDQERLIGSLCLNREGNGLAISDKGKTAAELMVFARYVMFSEVYWHHAVRSATVMFQRAFSLLAGQTPAEELVRRGMEEPEAVWYRTLLTLCRQDKSSDGEAAGKLFRSIFGPCRRLYKRVRQFSIMEEPELYTRLAGRPYEELQAISDRLVRKIKTILPVKLQSNDILIDSPPVDREVEFRIDVHESTSDKYRPLSEVSPVVRALAREQFDDYVKRVRIFVHPGVAAEVRRLAELNEYLAEVLTEPIR